MKKGLTEVVFIMDKSGSMYGLEADTIGGYNSFLEKQRAVEGECLISAVLFNHTTEVIHDRVPLEKIEPMTTGQYVPEGSTALLDAVGGAIKHIGMVHKYAREEDVPEKTIFVITTDGFENSSRLYDYHSVKKMIENQTEKYGWEFLFLGANMDAVAEGEKLGIRADRSVRFTCDGDGVMLNSMIVSEAVTTLRCHRPLTRDWKKSIEDYAERN